MEDTAAYKSAVNGWKQAVGIIEAQHKALDWCIQQFTELGMQGKLPQTKSAEYYEVLSAHRTGEDYVKAMRHAGANS